MIERLRGALADRYNLDREVGSGGMATVYLARDLKHNRQVAIKVLRPELSAVLGGERFLKEIELTANLQHPHLLPLFDSGTADGLLYYVMPYIEGESLRAKINREKQLGVEEALRITLQVAAALDYAHRHEVLHRDIKPENILLHDGQALIADFGIALALRHAGGNRLTETGLSLGTPQYMSPEQATGDRQLDARTDIYSLACVLYEMLSGEPPHTGPTVQAVIAKVVTDRPRPINELRSTVPAEVASALDIALAKLPADRFASIGEFAAALEGRPASPPSRLRTGVPGVVRSWTHDPRTLALAVVTVALLGLTVTQRMGQSRLGAGADTKAEPVRFTFTPPDGYTLTSPIRNFVVSPDGRMVAFMARSDSTRLFVRSVDRLDATPLVTTAGTNIGMAFSPDGRSIAYVDQSTIMQVPSAGGGRSRIGEAPTWTEDIAWPVADTIVLQSLSGSLASMSVRTGRVTRLTTPDSLREEEGHGLPMAVLDDGHWAFTVTTRSGSRIGVLAPDHQAWSYLPSETFGRLRGMIQGRLVIEREDGVTVAVPVNSRGQPTGESRQLESAQRTVWVGGSGTIVSSPWLLPTAAEWVDGEGRRSRLPVPPGGYMWLRLAPDGRTIAIGNKIDLRTVDVASGRGIALGGGGEPVWSPDGSALTYWVTSRDGHFLLASRRADASQPPRMLGGGELDLNPTSWSPDGKELLVSIISFAGGGAYDVGVLGRDGKVRPVVSGPGTQRAGMFSPDGRWIAFTSDESGRPEIYVLDWPRATRRWAISAGGGSDPVWSRDGRELYYLAGDKVMAVTMRAGPVPTFSVPRIRFAGPFMVNMGGDQSYDVAADGRLLMLFPATRDFDQVRVTLNWSPSEGP